MEKIGDAKQKNEETLAKINGLNDMFDNVMGKFL